MHYKKTLPLAFGLCLLQATSAYAAPASTSEVKLELAVEKLSAQTEELQQEVAMLKSQLKQVKQQKQQKQIIYKQVAQKQTAQVVSSQAPASSPAQTQVALNSTQVVVIRRPSGKTLAVAPEVAEQDNDIGPIQTSAASPHAIQQSAAYNHKTLNAGLAPQVSEYLHYLVGSPIVTSPLLNLRSRYDTSDLIVNFSNMNEDLRMLQLRSTLEDKLQESIPFGSRPLLILSGKIEAQGAFQSPYAGQSTSAFNLSSAELDLAAMANPWVFGFMSLDFTSAPLDPSLLGSGDPINNSNFALNRGFVTVGDVSEFPLYLSVGQMYQPFGDYSNYLVSRPVTKSLGLINARSGLLGFSKGGLYLSVYGFNGASVATSNNGIDDLGGNAGYKYSNDVWNMNIGGGYVNNLADSGAFQNVNNSQGYFQGFAQDSTTENLVHQAPAADGHASIGFGPFSIIGEYVATTRAYSPVDLTFNGSGAAPKASHLEGDYTFTMFNKPASLTFAYDETWQALALGLPKNSYIGVFNITLWRNTIESLEFRHDVNYASTDTAGGICDPNFDGTPTFCSVPQAGGQQNTVVAQIGVYW